MARPIRIGRARVDFVADAVLKQVTLGSCHRKHIFIRDLIDCKCRLRNVELHMVETVCGIGSGCSGSAGSGLNDLGDQWCSGTCDEPADHSRGHYRPTRRKLGSDPAREAWKKGEIAAQRRSSTHDLARFWMLCSCAGQLEKGLSYLF